ncbi:MAG: hemin ABC transporter substrate-binding protein [Archangium gephyra]|uniref:Hemin ABC transporter substrate-binding protein n=1 Tax=Archangium gephyra TaxID=48 RepID=A0A2W5SNQ1_9BACT|nr:MAG: hemin ABC transporter substrate-binding protein [Archangium gephyra]
MLSLALLSMLSATDPAQWLGPKPQLPVTRVVTLAPSLTETVIALGAAESLVGVSRFCEFPETEKLPKTGGFNDLSVETIVALKPQLVVVQKAPANQKAVETIARLGIPVLALTLTTIDDVSVAMRELGRALGRDEAAAKLVKALAEARAAAREVKSAKKKRVLFVYGFSPLVVAGPGSFAHELLEDCGAENAAKKAPTAYPTYSMEKVVTLVPDVIVDAADVKEGREALEKLAPMKKAKWVDLPTKDLLHPGPALAKALPTLCPLVR